MFGQAKSKKDKSGKVENMVVSLILLEHNFKVNPQGCETFADYLEMMRAVAIHRLMSLYDEADFKPPSENVKNDFKMKALCETGLEQLGIPLEC